MKEIDPIVTVHKNGKFIQFTEDSLEGEDRVWEIALQRPLPVKGLFEEDSYRREEVVTDATKQKRF